MLATKLLKHSFRFQQIVNRNNILLFQRKKDFNGFRFSSSDISSYDELGFLFENSNNVDKIPEIPTVVLNNESFASFGLNNYTPTGFVQFILENIHNTMELPWWACIVITAVFIKTITAPVLISQRRFTVKFQNSLGLLSKVGAEALDAHRSGNNLLMSQKLMVLQNMSENNVFQSKNFLKPILIQAPIFISVFTALKGMVDVSLPSLKDGGFWWFLDLTTYDPYYILPLIAGLSVSLIMESNIVKESHIGLKIGFRLFGPVIFAFFCHMPSTLVLYWSVSNTYSLIFALLLKSPSVQKALKIPNIIPVSDRTKQFGFKENKELLNAQREIIMREITAQREIIMQQKNEFTERKLAYQNRNKRITEEYENFQKSKINVTGEIVEKEMNEIK